MKRPTQRSLDLLRKEGWLPAVVEKWNPHAKCRQDLFGIIDIVAIRDGETLGVQATTASNLSKRIRKIEESDALSLLREAEWTIEVHGWRKDKKGRWVCKRVNIS